MQAKIAFQNKAPYAKCLSRQESGQLPLYLGPSKYGRHPSADLSFDQFLAYADLIKKYCSVKRDLDGNGALLLISDNGVVEIGVEDLIKGMAEGHLGEEAKTKAIDFLTAREVARTQAAEWAKERQGILQGAALRAL